MQLQASPPSQRSTVMPNRPQIRAASLQKYSEVAHEFGVDAGRVLQASGLDPDRVYQVSGKANSEPLYPDDPTLAGNRRIAIVLLREAPVLPPDHGLQ